MPRRPAASRGQIREEGPLHVLIVGQPERPRGHLWTRVITRP
jgi:hypothetical protein